MWLVWVPTVIAWQVLPGVAHFASLPLLRAPEAALQHPLPVLAWLAAGVALLAYFLTIPCWLTLGSNWSLAVVPGKETGLVTRGFYARTRHPIYSLGLLLMAATIAVAPSPAMLIVGGVHLTLVLLKAAHEERFLTRKHGRAYLEYCGRTGRFFPWPGKAGGLPASR
jgi:protein-S-isoprenylcysteine O-methyltransferase Ste14